MRTGRIGSFLRDDGGTYTIWSLVWFSLYVALGGLTVDFTDAYRTRTQLQSTADAAALAGVMSLADDSQAVAMAVTVGQLNMPVERNGHVVHPQEVFTGNWNGASDTFTVNGSPKNAVYVLARRDETHQNPLPTNFLRIAGFGQFDVSVDAVAVRFVPECLFNGLVAANLVDVTSGNGFHNDICIHGQNVILDKRHQDLGIDLNNGNVYDPGVRISTPNLNDIPDRQMTCANNAGFCNALREGDMWPRDADPAALKAIIDGLTITDPDNSASTVPAYMYVDSDGDPIVPQKRTIQVNYSGDFEPNTIYQVNCSGNSNFGLPTDVELEKVIIVADCRIHASSVLKLKNVVIASTSDSDNPAAIDMAARAALGDEDYCDPDEREGLVEFYTYGSVKLAAQGDINGVRIVAGKNVELTAQASASGISVQAGDSIYATARGSFGLCPGAVPNENFAWHYRLVR